MSVITKRSPKVGRVIPNAPWRKATLGDVVESMKNGIYKPASFYAEDGLACLRMYNIGEGQIVWRDIKRMRIPEDEIVEYELKPGDLLVNRVNSRELVGKSAVIPDGLERCIFESKNIRVRLRRDLVDPKFVSYQLLSRGSSYFTQNAQQVVGMASISQPQVSRFPLTLAPLREQRRIVAEIEKQFTRLDAGIAALRRTQANLKRYRAAVLKAACEGRLVPTEAELARKEALFGGSIHGKAREAGSTPAALHRVQKVVSPGLTSPTKRAAGSNPVGRPMSGFRDAQVAGSNLSVPTSADTLGVGGSTPSASPSFETGEQLLQRTLVKRRENWSGRGKYMEPQSPKQPASDTLPAGWTWATFEQLSERVTVGFVGSMKHEYVESGVPFLRGQNVRENRFDPDGLLYVSRSFHETLSKSALQPGDLAVVRSGGVGVTCVIPPTLKEANCSDLVLIQRPLGFIPQYGAYYMNSLAKRHVEAGKVGVALTHFNTKSVAALAVPLPPLSEQRRIVAEVERRLSVVEELETIVSANLQRATRLRQSILQRAFSGTPN